MKFSELGLNEAILRSVNEMSYDIATEIQQKSIPLILKNRDVLGNAQTGTGKTAAFALPILQLLSGKINSQSNRRNPKALIVTPTRELAIQIAENMVAYSKYTNIKTSVIYGGVKQTRQVNRIRQGVDILIATPGRLLDLVNQQIFSLSEVEYFVLDEADRMLDMGFIHDIKRMIKLLPKRRQNLFFSATMPKDILSLSKTILNNPIQVKADPPSSTAETLEQLKYYTDGTKKKDLLCYIIKNHKIDQALVFTRTKRRADNLCKFLNRSGFSAAAIHGNKSQNQRQLALSNFKEKKIKLLVATDIAARGIDISKLSFVINFDIPNISETYVHRIGRSGRAGEKGISISISEYEENQYIRNIEKLTNKRMELVKEHPYLQNA